MPAAVPAIPVNPRSAAIMAITRNMNAHLNMVQNAIWRVRSKGGVVLPESTSGLQSNTITGKSKICALHLKDRSRFLSSFETSLDWFLTPKWDSLLTRQVCGSSNLKSHPAKASVCSTACGGEAAESCPPQRL